MRIWRAEVFWLTLIAAVLLAIWCVPGASSISSDSFSVAHPGKKVLFQSLRRLEGNVQRSVEQLIPQPGQGDRLLVLGPARYPSTKEWNQLYAEVLEGGTLVFAARLSDPAVELGPFGAKIKNLQISSSKSKDAEDSADQPDREKEGPTKKRSVEPGSKSKKDEKANSKPTDDEKTEKDLAALLWRESTAETDLVDSTVNWRSDGHLELDSDKWRILVKSRSLVQAASRTFGHGTVIVLASDDIFSNAAMTDPKQALLAFRILEAAPPTDETWFDETLNSSGVPKVLGILFDPLFRPLTLQCILIVALFGWAGSCRFGPVEQTSFHKRRSIVEHARAVGVLYFAQGAGTHAVRALHEFLKLELRRLYGGSFRVDSAETISRVAQTDEAEVRTLLQQVTAANNTKLPTSGASRLLRGLSQLIARIRTESS